MKLHCVLPAVPDSAKYIKVQVFNNTKHRVYVHFILFVEQNSDKLHLHFKITRNRLEYGVTKETCNSIL